MRRGRISCVGVVEIDESLTKHKVRLNDINDTLNDHTSRIDLLQWNLDAVNIRTEVFSPTTIRNPVEDQIGDRMKLTVLQPVLAEAIVTPRKEPTLSIYPLFSNDPRSKRLEVNKQCLVCYCNQFGKTAHSNRTYDLGIISTNTANIRENIEIVQTHQENIFKWIIGERILSSFVEMFDAPDAPDDQDSSSTVFLAEMADAQINT
jgi:hypothetical protein